MQQQPVVRRIQEATPDETIRYYVRHRIPFSNTRKTFRGYKIRPLLAVKISTTNEFMKWLTSESQLAFSLDEPDYVVLSNNTPILWHSTTRGTDHRERKGQNEWVVPKLELWDSWVTQKRYNRMVLMLDGLNE